MGDASHWARTRRTGDPEPVREAARRLASHPAFLGEGAELLTALADLHAAPLAEVADLVAARPTLAVHLAGQLAESRLDADRLEDVLVTVRQLAGRADLAGGLFALALVGAAGKSQRWSEPWQEALHHLRRHPHPEVAEASYRHAMVR